MNEEMKDLVQVGAVNVSAIGLEITQCNEILTFVSLILAIIFTITKLLKYSKFKNGE